MNSSKRSTDSGTGGAGGVAGAGGDTAIDAGAGGAGPTEVWAPIGGMVDEAISSRRRVAASSLRKYLAMCVEN